MPTSPHPLPRIGLIGCGLIGRKRLENLPAGCVTWLCDQQRDRAERLATLSAGSRVTTEPAEVFAASNVDAVLIATLNASLAPLTRQALTAGKHVLVEKPGALRCAELDDLAALAERNQRVVRVGYNHRYHPACLKAREILDSGALGSILLVRGRYGQGGRVGYHQEWRAQPKLSGGGELIDQGVHLIDLAGMVLGPFETIEGHTATYFWTMPVEDNAFVSLRNAAGATAWLHASCTEWKNLFSLEIFGRHAKLHWEGLGGSYGVERLYQYQMLPEMGPPDTTIYEFPRGDQSWKLEMEAFFEDIRLQRPAVPGLKEARAALAVVEQLYARAGYAWFDAS